jgi:hypothetical protein
VFIYERAGGAWTETQLLRAPVGGADQRFGRSVAIFGDVIAVGEYDDVNIPFVDSGSVYVYRHDGSSFVFEQEVLSTDSAPGDRFMRPAIYGDVMVVGASGLEAAYVFRYNGASWVQEQKLLPLDTGFSFGSSVSIYGDVILVGDPQNSLKGAVYVFRHNGSSWVQEQKIVSTATRSGFDYFGTSLAVDANRIVIGEAPSGGELGVAYVYRFDGVDFVPETVLMASDDGGVDSITSVALSGDFVIGGAPSDDENGNRSGAGYLFRLLGQ